MEVHGFGNIFFSLSRTVNLAFKFSIFASIICLTYEDFLIKESPAPFNS